MNGKSYGGGLSRGGPLGNQAFDDFFSSSPFAQQGSYEGNQSIDYGMGFEERYSSGVGGFGDGYLDSGRSMLGFGGGVSGGGRRGRGGRGVMGGGARGGAGIRGGGGAGVGGARGGAPRGAGRGRGRGASFAPAKPAVKEPPKQFWCHSCDVVCTSAELLLTHMNGKKHTGRVVKLAKAAESSKVEAREQAKQLQQQQQQQQSPPQPKPETGKKRKAENLKPAMIGIQDDSYWCFPCSVSAKSFDMLQVHLDGKKHNNRLRVLGGPEVFAPPQPLGPLAEKASPDPTNRRLKKQKLDVEKESTSDNESLVEIVWENGVPGATSEYRVQYRASRAFEAQKRGFKPWMNKESDALPATVWYRLPAPVTVAEVSFASRIDESLHQSPTEFDLVGSNDCRSWETICSFETEFTQLQQENLWSVPADQRRAFRGIGIRVNKVKSGPFAAIQGIRMWKTQDDSIPPPPVVKPVVEIKTSPVVAKASPIVAKASPAVAKASPVATKPSPVAKVTPPPPVANQEPQPMTGIRDNTYCCFPCNVTCNRLEQLEVHLTGKKHAQKINFFGGENRFHPHKELGPLDLPPPIARAPRPERHLAPVRTFQLDDSPIPMIQVRPAWWCNVCNMASSTEAYLRRHLTTKRHAQMYESYEELRSKFLPIDGVLGPAHGRGVAQIGEKDNALYCFLCQESISGGDVDAHLRDAKHEAKIVAGEAEAEEEVRREEEEALAKAAQAEAEAAGKKTENGEPKEGVANGGC